MFTVNCIEKTKKEKDAGNGPLKKDKIERGTLSKRNRIPIWMAVAYIKQ